MVEIPTWAHVRHLEKAERLAKSLSGVGKIVEIGTFLGATTVRLGEGALSGTEIHCYDYFKARDFQQEKYPELGDYLKLFLSNVEKYNIIPHQGDIAKCSWNEGAIELYLDDAAKTPWLFTHVMKTFGPSFLTNTTKLMLMDLEHYQYDNRLRRFQSDFMKRHSKSFKKIDEDPATFLYLGGMKWDKLKVPWYARKWVRRAHSLLFT